MPILNPERSYIRTPAEPSIAHALEHNPASNVVFALKTRLPMNFNLALQAHAQEHHLQITQMGVHPHPAGSRLSLTVNGDLSRAKQFADSAVSKFGVYISHAEVGVAKQGIFGR
jgi:hypothetical protein